MQLLYQVNCNLLFECLALLRYSSETENCMKHLKHFMIIKRKTKLFAIIALILSGLFFSLVVFTSIPLGIPDDWVWTRITKFPAFPLYELIAIILFFATAVFFAFKIDFQLGKLSHKLVCVFIIIVMSMMFDYYVLLSGRVGVSEHVFAVIDPYTSGYLMVAGEIKKPGKYFSDFDKILEKDAYDSNHIDVHPFGNIAFCYTVLEWCRNSPAPEWLVKKLLPDNVLADVREAGKNGAFHGVSRNDAIYVAGALIVLLFLAMNFLSRIMLAAALLVMTRGSSRNLGLNSILLSFSIPAVILFLGQHDVMMFFIGAVCTLLLTLTIKYEWKKFPVFSVLTGMMLAVGVIHTLAFSMFIVAAILTIFFSRRLSGRYVKIGALTGGGLSVVLLCMFHGIDIVTMCLLASRNNSRFFAESSRCWYWFPFNLFDFVVFISPFLAILPLMILPKLKMLKSLSFSHVQALALSCVSVMLFLLVSPFSRGEMGRLLLFFMPLYALSACLVLAYQKLSNKIYLLCVLNAAAGTALLLAMRLTLKLALVFYV